MERGSIVVCIVGEWIVAPENLQSIRGGVPKKDRNYTIRELYSDPDDGMVGVRLDELKCPINEATGLEFGWDIRGFTELLSKTEYCQEAINNLIREPQLIQYV